MVCSSRSNQWNDCVESGELLMSIGIKIREEMLINRASEVVRMRVDPRKKFWFEFYDILEPGID